MADTTIKVDSSVRDRLAVLAAQRGATPEWTGAPPTRSTPADPPPTGWPVLTTTPEIYNDWGINTISVT
jgi:hypothetical protein